MPMIFWVGFSMQDFFGSFCEAGYPKHDLDPKSGFGYSRFTHGHGTDIYKTGQRTLGNTRFL